METTRRILCLTAVVCAGMFSALGEPTEMREWRATSGHKVEAKALEVAAGKVRLERADGSEVVVPLDKFVEADQEMLREHFDIDEESATGDGEEAPAEGEAADDLPFPLGTTTEEISCGDDFSYFLYFPESLRKGAKHPVLFVMSPGGGGKGNVNRYRSGAGRNRWIIAVSKQSKNKFKGSQDAIDAMIKHVTKMLPIDEDRMYVTGFSGGSRMAFSTSRLHKEIAGVLACGAGGNVGSSKQVEQLIEENEDTSPMRAYMWTCFLTEHKVEGSKLAGMHAKLGDDSLNQLYVKGLEDVSKFVQKQFGGISSSQWKSDPKVSAACKREATKYVGTPWEEILNKMSEDAQKF